VPVIGPVVIGSWRFTRAILLERAIPHLFPCSTTLHALQWPLFLRLGPPFSNDHLFRASPNSTLVASKPHHRFTDEVFYPASWLASPRLEFILQADYLRRLFHLSFCLELFYLLCFCFWPPCGLSPGFLSFSKIFLFLHMPIQPLIHLLSLS